MVVPTRFELVTFTMSRYCSTAELRNYIVFEEPNYPPERTHRIVSYERVYTTVIAVCGVIQPT